MQSQEDIKVNPMNINEKPRKRDVFGKANEFISDLEISINGEGMFQILGVQPDKTFLLAGEKGTGKTMSIQAINNERNSHILRKQEYNPEEQLGVSDFGIAVLPYDIGTYGTAYINMSSRRIQQFFDQAGLIARCGVPTLIMLDEADALLNSRKSGIQTHSEDKKTLETIMKNLQTSHDTPNLYVTLMTNYAEGCDDASLRAGRVDRKYIFELPNPEERQLAIKGYMETARERAGYNLIRKVNTNNLVELSEGFSYADITAAIDKSIRQRARELVESECEGIVGAPYITGNRLEKSFKEHSKEFLETKRKRIGFNGPC